MNKYRELFRNLLRDDSGQDMIEYALVAGLIALGAVTTMTTFAGDISTAFTNLGAKLAASTPS